VACWSGAARLWVTTVRPWRRWTLRSSSWAAARRARCGFLELDCRFGCLRGSGCVAGARRAQRQDFISGSTDGGEISLGGAACVIILAAVAIANAYPWPIAAYAAMRKRTILRFQKEAFLSPMGSRLSRPDSRSGVGVAMSFPGRRTRLRPLCLRDRRQSGGGPELAGVDTRWVIAKVFMLMGLLTPSPGLFRSRGLMRPQVGRHACRAFGYRGRVIGGTSLAGGVGTVLERCLAPCSCSRCSRAWCCSGVIRRCKASWSASFWSPRCGSTPSIARGARHDRTARDGGCAHLAGRDARHFTLVRRSSRRRWGVDRSLRRRSHGSRSVITRRQVDADQDSLRRPDAPISGTIIIRGEEATIANPRDAQDLRHRTIYQTLALADNVDAAANLLSRPRLQTAWAHWNDVAMRRKRARSSAVSTRTSSASRIP